MTTRHAELEQALRDLEARVARAAAAAGRTRDELTVVAVTKFFPLSDVEELAGLGLTDFGESREQELREKAPARPDLTWHFLGKLQTNKARSVGERAAVVHSFDREDLVAPLAKAANPRLRVLVQVSLDGDPARGGALPDDAPRLADRAAEAGLEVAGVMAIAPLGADPAEAFARLARTAAALRAGHPRATMISAGMSGDLEAAVACGATHLRVGTALLGVRSTSTH